MRGRDGLERLETLLESEAEARLDQRKVFGLRLHPLDFRGEPCTVLLVADRMMQVFRIAFDRRIARATLEHRRGVAEQVIFGGAPLSDEPADPRGAAAGTQLLKQPDRGRLLKTGRRVDVVIELRDAMQRIADDLVRCNVEIHALRVRRRPAIKLQAIAHMKVVKSDRAADKYVGV